MKRSSILWRLKPAEQRTILLIGDTCVSTLALFIGLYYWAAGDQWFKFSVEFLKARPQWWFWFLPLIWLLFLVPLYDSRRFSSRTEVTRWVVVAAMVSAAVYLIIYFTMKEPTMLPRRGVGGFIVGVTILTFLWRLLFMSIFTAPRFMRRVLIVGAGKSGTTLAEVIRETWPPPFYVVGMVDDDAEKIGTQIHNIPVIGGSKCLLAEIEKNEVSDLILAITGEISGAMFQAVLDAQEKGVRVTTMPVVYEELQGRVPIFLLDADWIVRSFVEQAPADVFYLIAKRLIDILGGLVGSVILLLMLPFVTLVIALDTGFPIFYKQQRLGRSAVPFDIIKFRTMVKDAEKGGEVKVTTKNDGRITRSGSFLRKTHLDEWPNFLNVLRGEMSMVGPRAERAELVERLQKEIPFYRARLLVKPGVSGWAQINFGYAETASDTGVKLEYDLYYIKHRNLMLDLIVLLRTFETMIGQRGQ
jgi:exopolysaccharide biosynthesis polyprenyl glycosylphosphotransferase